LTGTTGVGVGVPLTLERKLRHLLNLSG